MYNYLLLLLLFPNTINQQVVRQNVTGLQWISSDGWTTRSNVQTPHFMPYLRGTLGVALRRGEIPGLKDFLLKIHPGNDSDKSHEDNIVSLFF